MVRSRDGGALRMSEPALAIEGLHKRFGKRPALAGVDLELGAKELCVVLGPTGAGKTTLLRTIAGLEAADAGRIRIAGEDMGSRAPAERDVALVFQNFSLYPDRTVRANLEFPLRAPGRRESEESIAERVARAAHMLRIEALLDRPAARLSGGEMQRVAIGRAIVRRPRLFLFDEPLTNLDAKLRESLRVELVAMQRELGTPALYVTHDQAEALSMGDRIAILFEGRILQCGTPEEVYWRPASPTVARALGIPPINLVPAQRIRGAWVLANGAHLALASGGNERALLGIRPEDIELDRGSGRGRVRVVEDLGSQKIVLVDWAELVLHVLAPPTLAIAPGDAVDPRFQPDRMVVWPDPDDLLSRPT
jgi:multiple sugar transport system ATP-binding protein